VVGDSPVPVGSTLDAVNRFNDAINRHDAGMIASLLTDDSVFENAGPAPDGSRIVGRTAVVTFWRQWFASNPGATGKWRPSSPTSRAERIPRSMSTRSGILVSWRSGCAVEN
jgi:SnoaL-like domain